MLACCVCMVSDGSLKWRVAYVCAERTAARVLTRPTSTRCGAPFPCSLRDGLCPPPPKSHPSGKSSSRQMRKTRSRGSSDLRLRSMSRGFRCSIPPMGKVASVSEIFFLEGSGIAILPPAYTVVTLAMYLHPPARSFAPVAIQTPSDSHAGSSSNGAKRPASASGCPDAPALYETTASQFVPVLAHN